VLSLLPREEFVARIFADCAAWHVERADPRGTAETRSDVPTLLMSGSFDGATAPSTHFFLGEDETGLCYSEELVFTAAR
jgi:hypothetical protein